MMKMVYRTFEENLDVETVYTAHTRETAKQAYQREMAQRGLNPSEIYADGKRITKGEFLRYIAGQEDWKLV